MSDFNAFFVQATGHHPYPFQCALATAPELPSVLSIPTGLGKTAAVTLAWLWRRRRSGADIAQRTPRRLIYCLPMRVLAEQTRDVIVGWLAQLDMLGGQVSTEPDGTLSYNPWGGEDSPGAIRVFLLLGGDVERDWDRFPERDAILVGTQDLLLSRALARGYAMSRFRWPLQFGLVNNDALWVFDEVQLMGSGLATSTQLQAFRRRMGATRCRSIWMSATIQPAWLDTVDFDHQADAPGEMSLDEDDQGQEAVRRLVQAQKSLGPAAVEQTKECRAEAAAIVDAHLPGSRSLVVVNTVRRAITLYNALKKRIARGESPPELVLIHSRFRPPERSAALARLLREPSAAGTIAVSTQVVEAGVDVSARMLWTDIAPWSSMVQRFGRCNRKGADQDAQVLWFDSPLDPKREMTGPYRTVDLISARDRLRDLRSAAAADLPPLDEPPEPLHVLRRRDVLDLFDTSQDLVGADVDVSRFIRDGADHSVFVFWRQVDDRSPDPGEPRPDRSELCPAPVSHVRDRIQKKKARFWRWDIQERSWVHVRAPTPGMILMAPAAQGDYDPEVGWLQRPARSPVPVNAPSLPPDEGLDGDPQSRASSWQTIAEHTDGVVHVLNGVLRRLGEEIPAAWREALTIAARWHDRGKAHAVFQQAMPHERRNQCLWAKPGASMARYERPGFRHELASALAMLQQGLGDLPAYLTAAHHGKVRLSLRAQPLEREPPDPEAPFAMGVWEGDCLPATDLGGGVTAPETSLTLRYAELGEAPDTGPSWVQRVLDLRDDPALGPFRLAYLEALLRVADWRGSERPGEEGSHE